ncbi:MAG: HlyD family efflux transporter periplasmic adaptor subunit [Rhizobiales bacterium]|nr:HlyD family efflux transporter periplasmic adaptor subunit [Hyphomicrobiales bacterium]NRB15629.1 HlyD family efflux transporter periplasmic adaptor subunit [Hyphomicrobiales bacterium]
MAYKTLIQFNNNTGLAFFLRFMVSISVVAAITYAALSYFDLLNQSKPNIQRRAATEQAAIVDVLVVNFEDIQPTISNFGQIVAGKQLPLSASVSGRIDYISANFKNGALVKAGELLLELDNFQYQGNLITAKANLQDISFKTVDIDNQVAATEIAFNSTQTLYQNAQKDYAGSINLQKSGIITKQALDAKNMSLIQQKQSLDNMAASFSNLTNQKLQLLATKDAQQWALEKAVKDLENTKIYAPFDAYIHNANLEVGQFINANATIATLLDQQKIDVKFTLSDGQYGRIIAQDGTIIGRNIQTLWQVGQVSKTFDAVINRVNSEIVAASGGIDLYASISNVEAVEALRIGAFVKILIPDQTYSQVFKIPDHMIYDNDTVYVVARANLETGEVKLADRPKGGQRAGQRQSKGQGRRQGEQQGQGQDTQAEPNQQQGQRQGQGNRAEQGQHGDQSSRPNNGQQAEHSQQPAQGERSDATRPDANKLDEGQNRLEPVKVQIVGYTENHILIINAATAANPLTDGDALLQTRLTLAGEGLLVITSEQSAIKQAAALKRLQERGEGGEGGGNRRFGGRQQNPFATGGGGRR